MAFDKILREMLPIATATGIGGVKAGKTVTTASDGSLNVVSGYFFLAKISDSREVLPFSDPTVGTSNFWTASSVASLPKPPTGTNYALFGRELYQYDTATSTWVSKGQVTMPIGAVFSFYEDGYSGTRQKTWNGSTWLNPSSSLPPASGGNNGQVLTANNGQGVWRDAVKPKGSTYISAATDGTVSLNASAFATWLEQQGFYNQNNPPTALGGLPCLGVITETTVRGGDYINSTDRILLNAFYTGKQLPGPGAGYPQRRNIVIEANFNSASSGPHIDGYYIRDFPWAASCDTGCEGCTGA